MIISFDLDDTLICTHDFVPKEENGVPKLFRLFYKEPLRKGTVQLLNALSNDGWSLFIYTTSYRSVSYVKRLFKFYGINIKRVINQDIHDREVKGNSKRSFPSKLPPKFGIDLHVDDQDSFKSDSVQYGFDALVVKPEDENWVDKVLKKANQIKRRSNQSINSDG